MIVSKKNNDFHYISVGQQFDLFQNDYANTNGSVLEVDTNGDFFLIQYLANITPLEKTLLCEAKITVRMIKEAPPLVKMLICFGATDFISEINFNPLLYTDSRKDKLFKNNTILIIGVESTTNKIATLKCSTMPKTMFLNLRNQYQQAKKVENYNEKYLNWTNDLENKYTINELWEMGQYIGQIK